MPKKILILIAVFIVFSILFISLSTAAEDNKPLQIKLGTSYERINRMLGAPIKEDVKSSFWGNKKALYKLYENDYCIIKYSFSRAKNILFLEQITKKEAIEKFNQ